MVCLFQNKLVETLGGSIGVKSKVNEWTKFTFTIENKQINEDIHNEEIKINSERIKKYSDRIGKN